MGIGRYILDGDGQPVRESNLLKWAAWMESGDRVVQQDRIGGPAWYF